MKITTEPRIKLKQKVSQRFSDQLDRMNNNKIYQNLTHKRPEIQDGRHWP